VTSKGIHLSTILLLILALSLIASAQPNAGKHCSTAGTAGKWGLFTTGTVIGVGPVGAVGSFSQDAEGNIAGSQTRSLNGGVAAEALTGNVTVNPDCTATGTVNVFQSGTLVRVTTLDLIYVNNEREARAIFTALVLQPSGTQLPTVITVELKRLFPKDGD
jgi:hypothetical protein